MVVTWMFTFYNSLNCMYIYISKVVYVLYLTIERLLIVKKEINKKTDILFVMKHGALISRGQNYYTH